MIGSSDYYSARKRLLKKDILKTMTIANNYFMITWPDPVKDVVLSSGAVQKSNIWTRGTYNAGMMALYRTNHDSCLLEHTAEWGEKHNWGLKRGVTIRNTNEYLTGQTCIELFRWIQQNKNA